MRTVYPTPTRTVLNLNLTSGNLPLYLDGGLRRKDRSEHVDGSKRGTGQIRDKEKEDEIGMGIADARLRGVDARDALNSCDI